MESTAELAGVASTTTANERRRRNEHLLVHHLPPEVLRIVFKDGSKKKDYRSLFAIRAVCKYWLEIVDSYPALWTFVSTRHDDELVDMILQKSNNQPLSIELDNTFCLDRPPTTISWTQNFLNRIIPLADRLKWLDCEYRGAEIVSFLGLQFQNLETLKLHNPRVARAQVPLLQTPKLRYVDLQGVTLNWKTLSDLRAVVISKPIVHPTADELYILFTNCPRLEVFRVQGKGLWRWPRDDTAMSIPSVPVLLPHLHYLLLSEVRTSTYIRLLSLINTPSLKRLFSFRRFNFFGSTLTFEPVIPFFGSYPHSLNRGRDDTRLRINGLKKSFGISLGACNVVFKSRQTWCWKLDSHQSLTLLPAALSRFDGRVSDNIRTIHFGGVRSREDLANLGPILQRHFPNVEELVVTLSSSEGKRDAYLVLEALKSPLPLGSEPRWLFPGLTTLHLKAGRQPVCDGVLGVVEARRNGEVQAIQRVSIKNGRIGRNTAAKLNVCLHEFRMAGTRYVDVSVLETMLCAL